MSKYIKIDDLRLHLQNLVLDGERLDPKTTRLIIMTLRELPIHEFDDECENGQTTVSEDCIGRADLIESFLADNECKREEAKACMCSLDLMLELIEDAPSVTPTVSDDCISRQKAIETCDRMYPKVDRQDIKAVIEATPSVTPTERTGEWVNSKGEPVNDSYSVYCSRCKAWSEYRDIYCGNCGAKMGGDDNE